MRVTNETNYGKPQRRHWIYRCRKCKKKHLSPVRLPPKATHSPLRKHCHGRLLFLRAEYGPADSYPLSPVFMNHMLEDLKDEDYVELLDSGLLVPHYLIHSFLYYEVCRPLIEDHQFDALARRLYDEWDEVDHVHKGLIDRSALLSGGAYLRDKYPLRAKQSALSLL